MAIGLGQRARAGDIVFQRIGEGGEAEESVDFADDGAASRCSLGRAAIFPCSRRGGVEAGNSKLPVAGFSVSGWERILVVIG